MKARVASVLTGGLVGGAVIFALITTGGCVSKGCDPKPMPKDFTEIAELVPPQTKICGVNDGALRIYFPNAIDAKTELGGLTKAAEGKGWARSAESAEGAPAVTLTKGPSKVDITFTTYKGDIYANLELGPIQ